MNAFKKTFDTANGFTTFTTAACHMLCAGICVQLDFQ